jgi:hypothetical protein
MPHEITVGKQEPQYKFITRERSGVCANIDRHESRNAF